MGLKTTALRMYLEWILTIVWLMLAFFTMGLLEIWIRNLRVALTSWLHDERKFIKMIECELKR